MKIAAFGIRSLPPRSGAAGADKFALELFPRLAELGCEVTVYTRVYPGDPQDLTATDFRGVRTVPLRTVSSKGFDTLLHSAKATWRILTRDGADVVHIQNGGNSPFATILRLFGKKTFVSQDGPDWLREKWPWYAKLYLKITQYITAYGPTSIIFDNIFARKYFENKFSRKYFFVPFGADVEYKPESERVLERLGLRKGQYFLFVGRFIPDKCVDILVDAFNGLSGDDLRLVLVGGSPNPSDYEKRIVARADDRVIMPGYIYGEETHALMKNALCYVQPSNVEGLSPVILESAFLGAPIVCSDIEQNQYAMREHAIYFAAGSAEDLRQKMKLVFDNPKAAMSKAAAGQAHVRERFNWATVARDHLRIFRGECSPEET